MNPCQSLPFCANDLKSLGRNCPLHFFELFMKIYTKGGDTGQTSLFGGQRVSKDDLRIRTYGGFDELNACIGLVLSVQSQADVAKRLLRVQGELFQLGAELATPIGKKVSTQLIVQKNIQTLEQEIDEMEAKLSPLKTFILPGGSQAGAALHLARTVCRRAERDLVTLHTSQPVRAEVLQYINRLSDYLFVIARFTNQQSRAVEQPWIAP